MNDPVTLDTITDTQIRELRDAGLISQAFFEFATYKCWYNVNYRDRCARLYNEHSAQKDAAAARIDP